MRPLLLKWLVLVILLNSLWTDAEAAQVENSEDRNDNSSSIIPPIFVLNMDRSSQRWENAVLEMKHAGLEVSRLPAVDGRDLSEEELLKESTKMATFFQPKGVIGCYLSHRKFWQMVVDQNLESAIVFEDDVELVEGFKEELTNNLEMLAAEAEIEEEEEDHTAGGSFDVILLGAIGRVHPQGNDPLGSWFFSTYIGGKREFKTVSDTRYTPRRPAGTHAYMVSNKGARKLLRLCTKASYHVDLDAWRQKELELTMFSPMLAYQTFEHTSLTDMKTKRARPVRKVMATKTFQNFRQWAGPADPLTRQPWSHILAEPLIQLGPGGPVLTVERHLYVVGVGIYMSMSMFRGLVLYTAVASRGSHNLLLQPCSILYDNTTCTTILITNNNHTLNQLTN